MRQFILTENHNYLHYIASTPAYGLASPANEFVDLAITYKDRFRTPLAGKSLVWQLVEGEATLSQQTTTTGSDGNSTNSIQVSLSDPSANATIRLAVWPQDEPDSKLEFECLFGGPKAAPPLSEKNNQTPVSIAAGVPRITSVKPQPNDMIFDARMIYPFIAAVENSPGGEFTVGWVAGGISDEPYFDPQDSSLNANNLATSDLSFQFVPQGYLMDFDVLITCPGGASYKEKYKVAANKIDLISTVNSSLPIGTPLTIQYLLKDYNGNPLGGQKLYIEQNNEITVSDFNPVTNGNGIATIRVSSNTPLTTYLYTAEGAHCVPTTIQLNFCEKKQNNITINPPTTDIRYDTRGALIATYVDGSGNPVPTSPLDIDFKLLDGTPVPHLTYSKSVNTDPYGKSAFWFYYSTDAGYPTSPVSMIATVSTPDGAAPPQSTRLDFIGGSLHNSMTLVQPAAGAPWPVGTVIEIIVRLTNDQGTSLSNYNVKWNLPIGVSHSNEQDTTDPDGRASVKVTALSAGLLNFTVDVPDANISGFPFSINFDDPHFTSVEPQPDGTIYEASKSYPFNVTVQDENGAVPSGRFDIAWDASMQGSGRAYFQPTPTSLNANGLAASTVFFLDVPQGKVQDFDVTITPAVGAPYTGTYKVTANKITQVSPAINDPIPIGAPTPIQVSLTNYNGSSLGGRKLIVEPNNEITVSDYNPETNGDGIATIWVSSTTPRTTFLSISEAAHCVPTTIQLTFCVKQNNNITINPPTTDIRYDSTVALIATYVDGSGNPVPTSPLNIDFKLLDGTPVTHLTYPKTVNTDPYGTSAFWFYYSTDSGYPTSPVSMIATVSTPDGAAPPQSMRLDFIGGSLHNSMTLVQPAAGAPWPVGIAIEIIVRLTNNQGTPLSNYNVKWNLPAGVSSSNEQDTTGSDGQASVMVTALSAGLLDFTVDVPDASIIGYPFSINFGGQDIYHGQLVNNKIYAHNPPGATVAVYDPAKLPAVNPNDDSQVVTFTYTYTKNGVPQPGEWIRWKTEPMSTSLSFFKADNTPTDVRPGTLSTDIFTQTDQYGRAVLKVGGVSAFVGSMGAFPDSNPSIGIETSNFIINTFDESGFENNLGFVTYTPPTLDISEYYSIDRPNFKLYVPEMSPEHKIDRVVFWIKSGITSPSPREVVNLVDMQSAVSGVGFPFNDIVPDTDIGHSNRFSFMLVGDNGQGYRSIFVTPPSNGRCEVEPASSKSDAIFESSTPLA